MEGRKRLDGLECADRRLATLTGHDRTTGRSGSSPVHEESAVAVWYLAELLFTEPPQADRTEYQCESCNVVFQATDAAGAYQKAVAWGLAYAAEPPTGMRLLGVSHLTTVGDELVDGTEICGRFFQTSGPWCEVAKLVPPPGQLKAILWEQNRDVPIRELLNPKQVRAAPAGVGQRRRCGNWSRLSWARVGTRWPFKHSSPGS